jgi:predicted porin
MAMKFRITTLAALAAVAGMAQAQSSVTVFGVLDVNLRQVSNDQVRVTQVGTDGVLNSRIGFRAEEDLGGGLKAGAWLEAAVNPDTGSINASGKLFHRRSTVSLSGGFGEIRIGRDLDPSYWNLAIFDPFSTLGVGSGFNLITNLGSGAATLFRADNAVAYFLPPNLGGFYGQAMWAPDEGVPGNGYKGARLGYQSGPLNVAMAASRTTTATSDAFKVFNAGVSYDLKVVKLFALTNRATYGAKKQVNWELGVSAPVSAASVVRASYQRANASGAGTDAKDASQIAFGYQYNLSRRTALYGAVSQLRNKGTAAYAVSTPPAAVAGGTSRGYEVGIMHSF